MNLVALILVGNEAELIGPVIRHTLGLGVDAFVIVDTASHDGTAEILQHYTNDPRFDIQFLSDEQVYSENFVDPTELARQMVHRARDIFKADWVLRLDADEFWTVGQKSLKAICAEATTEQLWVRRYNAVQMPGGPDLEVLAAQGRVAQIPVMARPFPNTLVKTDGIESLPLNFTRIAEKPLVNAQRLDTFSQGGHLGLDASGAKLSIAPTDEVATAHLWFTSPRRFLQKARFIRSIDNTVRAKKGPDWQWDRWSGCAQQGEESILAEFARQMPDRRQFDLLTAQGRVASAGSLVTGAKDRQSRISAADTDADARDLAQLGWLHD